jgi:hypothetical protein
MDAKERMLAGALSGSVGTLVLSGLREAFSRMGLVFETAPMQVVDRAEELGLVEGWSPRSLRFLTVAAHIAYGLGAGTALGLLRRERGGAGQEAAVGAAMGVLVWGAGWSSWLPLTGVHSPPWEQHSAKVLLPVIDHAVYGAAWGLIYWILTRRRA